MVAGGVAAFLSSASFDFSKSRRPMLIVENVRIVFLCAVLFLIILLQALQPNFVNLDTLLPSYLILAGALLAHSIYVVSFDFFLSQWRFQAFLFAFDALAMSLLVYATGVSHSIFLFLYLVNIILCGLIFLKRGAVLLAAWTSFLFSFLIAADADLAGQAFYLSLVFNNLAFFAVAFLSGYLSEQINFMGLALQEKESGLRSLQSRHRLIVENVASGLITADSAGRVIQCNPEGEKILGLSSEDLSEESIDDVFPGVWSFIQRRDWMSVKSHQLDFQLQNAEGENLIIEVVVSSLSTAKELGESESDGYVLLFQDLTRVRKLEAAMRQSEKLAAVGQLAAGIAHEIRNPLASMSGSIQLLDSSDNSPDDKQRLMKIVLREIDRLNDLITEFLDFARPSEPVSKSLDLHSLTREVAEMLRVDQRLRKDVVQNVKLSGDGVILGDQDKLKQALLNILINSYQALEKTENPQIWITASSTSEKASLSLRDNGSGMNEITRKKLFEPFHTTKPKGTGLGLAVTHKILENHGAEIEVRSELGVGSEFLLDFPLLAAQKVSIEQVETSLSQSPLERGEESLENKEMQRRGNG